MVVFVHMASVWVPFTSESKEAIADYDEIRKEMRLALQECGRRLGVFLRRRERAKSEFRRRNIFELYIEEVVEACARLKGGKLAKEKLKNQLQRIALKRTGGAKTDEILGHESGPEGLPNSIVVTPEGTEGEAPAAQNVAEGISFGQTRQRLPGKLSRARITLNTGGVSTGGGQSSPHNSDIGSRFKSGIESREHALSSVENLSDLLLLARER